jgi:hypothetical protein
MKNGNWPAAASVTPDPMAHSQNRSPPANSDFLDRLSGGIVSRFLIWEKDKQKGINNLTKLT